MNEALEDAIDVTVTARVAVEGRFARLMDFMDELANSAVTPEQCINEAEKLIEHVRTLQHTLRDLSQAGG